MKIIYIYFLFIFMIINLQAAILLDLTHYNSRLHGTGEAILVENGDLNNMEIFPSSLATIQGYEISTGYIHWAEMVNLFRLAYGHRIGDSDVVGIAINYAGFKEANNYNEAGTVIGQLNNKDLAINIAYALKLSSSINIGMDIKYLNMAIENYTGDWLGFTLSGMMGLKMPGLDVLAKDNFLVGIGLQNISIMQAKFDQAQSDYPMHIRSGFVWDIARIKTVTTKIGSSLDYVTKYNRAYINTGLELGWHNLLFVRTGISFMSREFSKYNFGLGLNRQITNEGVLLKFDYSISLADNVQSHFIQIGVGF